jgi:hypothetical protein
MEYEILREYDDVLSVHDLQKILHVGKDCAYALVANGTIKSFRIVTIYKLPKPYLIEYLYS